MTIVTFGDLIEHFEPNNNTPSSLSRRVYKDTSCGAWLSLETADGKAYEEHEEIPLATPLSSVTIGSIVEGSEAAFDQKFETPCDSTSLDRWIEELEALTDEAWQAVNAGEELE